MNYYFHYFILLPYYYESNKVKYTYKTSDNMNPERIAFFFLNQVSLKKALS